MTERAVPTAIFSAEPAVQPHYLRKWLKDSSLGAAADESVGVDVRDVLDWDYYRERLSKTVQKIITIPAAEQRITNPVPRVEHPEWLRNRVRALTSKHRQRAIDSQGPGRAAPGALWSLLVVPFRGFGP